VVPEPASELLLAGSWKVIDANDRKIIAVFIE
jgi:hypothetical protein